MSEAISQADVRSGRVAAIYARVSSERQRQEETIQSQTAGLRELAAARGLLVSEDLVFEDEGFSGATLQRPALERLRDRAADGAFEVLLCHAPDRLARRTPRRLAARTAPIRRVRPPWRARARAAVEFRASCSPPASAPGAPG
jgi:predicted site-specific integrase-resolvase